MGEVELDLSRFAEATTLTEKLKLTKCADENAYIEISVKSSEIDKSPVKQSQDEQ